MTRRLIASMALLAGLVAVVLAVPLAAVTTSEVRATFIADLSDETLASATLLAGQPPDQWPASVEAIAVDTGARVVVVDAGGRLVADSENSSLGRPFDRPEIADALAGTLTSDTRPSVTLGTELRFVAAPVVQGQRVVAAVRLTMPESQVDAVVRETQIWLAAFVLAVVVAAITVAWLIARSIGGPLADLAAVAASLPDGLDQRADERRGPREVRAVAGALNVTAARLQGILDRTQRVAADASHHLRTPLTGIRLRLEAIEEVTDQQGVRADAVAATAEVDRLTHRIGQILELARADAGAGAGDHGPVELASVVRARVEEARVIADERGVLLEDLIAGDSRVPCSAGALARIVDELLGNALAYARTRIIVEARDDEGLAVLSVDDDGPGVEPGELDRIFTRFQRGATAVPGGSGLGLALVRESAEAVGGTASAEASALGGLRVSVCWPASGDSDGRFRPDEAPR